MEQDELFTYPPHQTFGKEPELSLTRVLHNPARLGNKRFNNELIISIKIFHPHGFIVYNSGNLVERKGRKCIPKLLNRLEHQAAYI